MAIELTVQRIINARKPVEELLEVPMPAQTAFRLSRLVRKLNAEIEPIGEAIRNLNGKYLDANGKPMSEADGKEHQAEWDALMESTVEIDWSPLDPGILGGAPVRPGIFVALDWVFKD